MSAWAVPTITLATAAPAMAVSGGAAMSVPTLTAVRTLLPSTTALRRLVVTSTISNGGTQATTALLARVTLVNTQTTFGYANSEPFDNPSGWVYVGKEIIEPNDDVIMTYMAVDQVDGGASTTFNPIIDIAYSNAGDITVLAVPGGAGTSGTATFSFP